MGCVTLVLELMKTDEGPCGQHSELSVLSFLLLHPAKFKAVWSH